MSGRYVFEAIMCHGCLRLMDNEPGGRSYDIDLEGFIRCPECALKRGVWHPPLRLIGTAHEYERIDRLGQAGS